MSEGLFGQVDVAGATPVMAQYLEIKRAHKDALLLFHMGDFYELFFSDAIRAAEALDIALTRRGRYKGEDIPMCGVPLHASQSYIARLVRAGFKIVIADQTETAEDAKKRGAKGPMRRKVTRIITAGTLTQEEWLDARAHNHLAALAVAERKVSVAWMDLSTGSFWVQSFGAMKDAATMHDLEGALARIEPSELLLPMAWMDDDLWQPLIAASKDKITPLADNSFRKNACARHLEQVFNCASLESIGVFSDADICAAGAMAAYVEETLCGGRMSFSVLRRYDQKQHMLLDSTTMRHLELFYDAAGGKKGALLSAIDKTLTAMGGRAFALRLAAPLRDVQKIAARHDAIQCFLDNDVFLREGATLLRQCPDIERAFSRIVLGRLTPPDMAAVRQGLVVYQGLFALAQTHDAPQVVLDFFAAGHTLDAVRDLLRRALCDMPPLSLRQGGVIRKGYDSALDDLNARYAEEKRKINRLELRYSQETGASGLKIRYNALIGSFVEVKTAQAEKLRARQDIFRHRQSLAQTVRFVTDELLEVEQSIHNHGQKSLAMEEEIFAGLRDQVVAAQLPLQKACAGLAAFDVALGGAIYAREHRATRPQLDESMDLMIAAGRHPVVEQMPLDEGGFIPNDCGLCDQDRLWLLTGPNMAGKSTFLRQNALMILMAQAGLYVPAQEMRGGIVDRIFSRVGASDDLARGRSTFMVEMMETAAILHQASRKSFIILDEIGRGTATYDVFV